VPDSNDNTQNAREPAFFTDSLAFEIFTPSSNENRVSEEVKKIVL
jgi:hypothetical protein